MREMNLPRPPTITPKYLNVKDTSIFYASLQSGGVENVSLKVIDLPMAPCRCLNLLIPLEIDEARTEDFFRNQ